MPQEHFYTRVPIIIQCHSYYLKNAFAALEQYPVIRGLHIESYSISASVYSNLDTFFEIIY